MRICIYGAGAVGGAVAARLIATGQHQVSVIARGDHLRAIRTQGLTVRTKGVDLVARPDVASDDPGALPPQDLVLVTLKAPALPEAAEPVTRLLAPGACAVFVVNGIPWWWRYGRDIPAAPLPLLDPAGRLWARPGPDRVLGCVVYSGAEVVEPGLIVHRGTNRWIFGEPDGTLSPRLRQVAALFEAAGLAAETSPDLRRHIWLKLVANASRNPVGSLSRLDNRDAAGDPDLHRLMTGAVGEIVAIAGAMGWDIGKDVDAGAICNPAQFPPAARSSMLQDVMRGRRLEVEAILGQVHAFGRELGIETPVLNLLTPLLRGLDQSIGRAPQRDGPGPS